MLTRTATIPCTKTHYWCRQHASEICSAFTKALQVRHATCTLDPMTPAPAPDQIARASDQTD